MTEVDKNIIAYCGLNCAECEAYTLTQKNDTKGLEALAVKWSKMYGSEIKASDCYCDGCRAEGRKMSHCAVCPVRSCAMERGVETCAHCDDAICEKLTGMFGTDPGLSKRLETIRQTFM